MGELKYKDTDISDATIDTTAQLNLLNGMTQGSDVGNRVGRQITVKSVQLKGYLSAEDSTAGEMVYWALVYDKQPNEAVFTWDDVWTVDALYPQLRNLNFRKRFKVIAEQYVPIPLSTGDHKMLPFEFYKKVNLPVEYNSTNGGTIADITTGSLYFVMRGSTAAATNPSLKAYARIRFLDT